MFRKSRMAAFTVVVTLALSGLALAQGRYGDRDGDRDDDDGYYRRGNHNQAREYGHQNGYRDGYARGQHEGRENDPSDFRTPDWRQAGRGYENWMGPFGQYQNGYRDGYGQSFRVGFQSIQSWRRGDGDGDDRAYPRPVFGGFGGTAFRWGFADGSRVAREDLERGKPYRAEPRGPYEDRDRGYASREGDQRYYKERYSEAYRQGYARTWAESQGSYRRYMR